MFLQRMPACALVICLICASCATSPEAKRDRFLARGKQLLEKGDPARAILEFRNAAQAMPRDAEPMYLIATAALATGDLTTGVGSLRKALDLNPKHTQARLRLAQIMANASDNVWVKEAEERLRALMGDAPGDPAVLNALALAELKLGKTEAAIKTLESALASAPADLAASVLLARAKATANDLQGAESVLKTACERSPKSANPRVTLGMFYMGLKRLSEAEAEFRKAAEIDPKSALAVFNLARLQNAMGRKKEAEEGFRRASTLGSGTYKPVYALFLFEEGRQDEAVREFEKLANEDPDDRVARTRLVIAYRAVDRSADAAKVLTKALSANGNDLDALIQRGEMYLETADYAAAETDLNRVVQLKPDSGDVHYLLAKLHRARGNTRSYKLELTEALQRDPFLVTARIDLAQQLLADKEHKAATALLDGTPASQKELTSVLVQRNWVLWTAGDMAAMRKGIDEGLKRERSADLLVQDGVWKLRAGNAAGARASLEEALNLNPSDVRAMGALNLTYAAQKQGHLALQKVKEYASKQPKSAPVQEFLGLMLLGSGDRAQARQVFEMAKTADPKFVRADLSLVQLDVLDSRWDEAQKRLERMVASDSTNSLARLWLGNIHATKGNMKVAMEEFRQVVAADSRNAQALNNLAYLLSEVGNQHTEALKYAQKAKELVPDSAEYSDTLGWIFYRQGLYSMAVSELERAAAQKGNPVWKYHLAMAYAKAGKPERGRAMLKVALAADPNVPEARTAQEMLAQ